MLIPEPIRDSGESGMERRVSTVFRPALDSVLTSPMHPQSGKSGVPLKDGMAACITSLSLEPTDAH